jgi:hypothetical protein
MFISKNKLEDIKGSSWNDGFDVARKKAVAESKKVFVKLLTEELNDSLTAKQTGAYLKGLERAIEIIRKGKR